MASFAPIRGSRADIGSTPIVDGQFLVETDTSTPQDNRIYLDIDSTHRVIIGGNANYIFVDANEGVVTGNATTQTNGTTVTFTNNYITNASVINLFTEECTDVTGTPKSGSTNELKPLNYTWLKVDGSTHTVSAKITSVPNGSYYKFVIQVYT